MDKDITVPVPEDRVAEFFSMYGAWLAQTDGGDDSGADQPSANKSLEWDAEAADDAAWLYRKLSNPARKLFDVLMDAPGEKHEPDDLARRLGIGKGGAGIAGLLAWPGRWCVQINRRFPIAGGSHGGSQYYMKESVADVFRIARERAAVSQ